MRFHRELGRLLERVDAAAGASLGRAVQRAGQASRGPAGVVVAVAPSANVAAVLKIINIVLGVEMASTYISLQSLRVGRGGPGQSSTQYQYRDR